MSIVWKFLRLYSLLEDRFYQLRTVNECATTIQDNTGATGLVSMPQLELVAILRVRIEYHTA